MNEILKMLNALTADELDSVILRASIILEKKREEEAEAALREKERQRQERIQQEKRRQEEIAKLQRKLKELQDQKVEIPEDPNMTIGDNFIMYDVPKSVDHANTTAAKAASAQLQSMQKISCPHCHTMNMPDSKFCENCGKKMSVPEVKPQTQAAPKSSKISCPYCQQLNNADSVFCERCGKKMVKVPTPSSSRTGSNPVPRPSIAQVRYADESMKNWELHPGEKVVRNNHEIILLKPDAGKYAYYMEITNERILLAREGSGSKNLGMAVRMGGGLLGSLIAEGVKAAAGGGPKPWLEIPLTSVSNCGVMNKKEFFIVADQSYVLKNKSYEKFLPDLVANVKNSST